MEVPWGVVTSGWRANASTVSRAGNCSLSAARHERHEFLTFEHLRRQVRVAQRQLGEADLAPTLPDLFGYLVHVLGLDDPYRHGGMGAAEGTDERSSRMNGERRQANQVEVARLESDDVGHRGPGDGRVAQGLTRRAEDRLACRRQADRSRRPIEQLDPELGLERPHGLRQRRLGDHRRFGGAG